MGFGAVGAKVGKTMDSDGFKRTADGAGLAASGVGIFNGVKTATGGSGSSSSSSAASGGSAGGAGQNLQQDALSWEQQNLKPGLQVSDVE